MTIFRRLMSVFKYVEDRMTWEEIGEATKVLAARSINKNPNYHFLGSRFEDYENALLNIKQMGYYIGQQEFVRNGIAEKFANAELPSRTFLKSKLCTQEDCETSWFFYWLKEMRLGFVYHRKLWEFAYIVQQLYAADMLRSGRRGLGFGCGTEPLPSLFAKYGAAALGTDLAPDAEAGAAWIAANAHSSSRDKLINKEICEDAEKLELINHAFADMNHIPAEYNEKFDFTWSSCALEHVGSIELGLAFIENSLNTLKPGGIAVHTTEYNLDNGETLDNWGTVLFQRKHMEQLASRLSERGFLVEEFDFGAGSRVLDGLFDIPPWPWDEEKQAWRMLSSVVHLKKSIHGFPCTSIGITIRKPN